MLRARLPYLREWTTRRRALATRYRDGLREVPIRVPPESDPGHVYHLFPIRTVARDRLRDHLRDRNIETLTHYPTPLPAQPAFADMEPNHSPVAAAVCGELLSLPLYPSMTEATVTRAVDAVASNNIGVVP